MDFSQKRIQIDLTSIKEENKFYFESMDEENPQDCYIIKNPINWNYNEIIIWLKSENLYNQEVIQRIIENRLFGIKYEI